jgi:PPOX class probable F420-dependent enzyme
MTGMSLIPASVRRDVARARIGRFATDSGERLGLVPVCFVLLDDTLYHAIDAKPKRVAGGELARVANIRSNPRAALLVDHYEEDWRRLWYALFRGRARIIERRDEEQRRAIVALRRKYVQYRASLPLAGDAIVIALDAEQLTHWQASSAGRRPGDRRDWRA